MVSGRNEGGGVDGYVADLHHVCWSCICMYQSGSGRWRNEECGRSSPTRTKEHVVEVTPYFTLQFYRGSSFPK